MQLARLGLRVQTAGLQRRNLTTKTLEVVKATLPAVAKAGPAFTEHFYSRMFKAHPELLNTFNKTNQRGGRQPKALFQAIAVSAVNVLEHGTLPMELIEGINHKHAALNVLPAQYDVVGEHILGTITDLLNPGQEVLDAWGELYGALASTCIAREEQLLKEAESRPGGWRGLRNFTITGKEVKSAKVTKFTFTSEDEKPVSKFAAGQYTTVWLHPKEWENRQPRHYSLIAGDVNSYSIAVKKEGQGLVSAYLHDHMGKGDAVQLSPPFGNFSMEGVEAMWTASSKSPVVLLSAGVGITPMLSMLGSIKNGVVPDEQRQVVWLHSASNGMEHPFRDYLIGLGKAHPEDMTRRVWYSHATADDVRGEDNRASYHFDGRMDLQQVKGLLPLGDQSAQYYFCGPVSWMQSVASQLVDLGVSKGNLHHEVFGPNTEVMPQ